ncbi:metal ABC transporter ATP-binding protein [Hippea alviniae]|uniref:metal ABC transporter ATP-binding protein n=1 Tax=Hippea alviniae TaxID=1279027 RepID=UPI0003B2F90D|nr:metal ABC transporter ATP-binding protein [Hippea alviniae]
MIKIKDLTIRKGNKVVLDSINMSVDKGEFVAIVGPNGAGKTTLIRAVLGLEKPYVGSIEINGHKPEDVILNKILKISYLPQKAIVNWDMPLKVIDVVLIEDLRFFGLFRKYSDEDIKKAKYWLEVFGIEDRMNSYIKDLSGGQQQRVSLARCMVKEPDILILDEPNTAVDAVYNFKMYETLKKLSKEKNLTIIMVSHDIGAVTTYVDKIMCLNVRLYCHGSPSSINYSEMLKNVYGESVEILMHGEQCKNCPMGGSR